ncbi:lantibiotic protection ABC transporter ATP-binding subunit [Vagococcus vulneris]|uniref:Lantibiotic ABC transporter ATP-binding protein n=1 Tax=Vagococcus vulneris TaxID=1977869 RepID=A0A429ZZC8_9ENTE|nr:lantibiotic protection ABC transporter ATP-binding subunit [Vagococcus vulneris]RST99372.1 lantibiotic ABC transporter ATP-binding protein [Vagococcus vulneris]
MNTYKVQMTGIVKKYKRHAIINDLNLNVPQGRVYGLLGANGAGKSTTLKMLVGMIKPTSGEILIDGHPLTEGDLLKIGTLIEDAPLYRNLSAYENLLVRATILGVPEERIHKVLHQVDLSDTGKKKVKNFSMGMKQRLGIALALINMPSLLILDEPTNGLDPVAIKELRHLIKTLKKQGITIIVSSHILAEIESVADNIGIIYNGKLGYEGKTPENIEALEALFFKIVQPNQAGV